MKTMSGVPSAERRSPMSMCSGTPYCDRFQWAIRMAAPLGGASCPMLEIQRSTPQVRQNAKASRITEQASARLAARRVPVPAAARQARPRGRAMAPVIASAPLNQ
ncbi:MAG: hypothetical protein QM783_00450 [Phycisphaerales bacterium]